MQVFPEKDYQLFKNIVTLTQEDLHLLLYRYLKKKYKEIINTESYLIGIGDIPVALVAHMDTVFDEPPKQIYFDDRSWTFWSPDGLGADDRAGIYIILKILQKGLRPTVIFTTDEEIGGIGATELVSDYPKMPTNLKYLIQLDRRNHFDAVFYDCGNTDFMEYIESFGFCYADGIFSDISILCPAWNIAGVNLSVGYINEHSYLETCNMKIAKQTCEKVIEILQQKEHEYFDYQGPDFNWFVYNLKCSGCGKIFYDYEMIPVETEFEGLKYFCPDCSVNKIEWCEKCGNSMIANKKHQKICYRCKKENK